MLRSEGLTERGEDKVRKGDLRCRPSKRYREVLLKPKSLPQFRLSTVVNAAHAEDLVVLWAYLTRRGKKNNNNNNTHTVRHPLSPAPFSPRILQFTPCRRHPQGFGAALYG